MNTGRTYKLHTERSPPPHRVQSVFNPPCTSSLTAGLQEGYRTLCVAYKKLSTNEYASADEGLQAARLALQDREEKLMAVYNQVETGMTLIGATAVEDRWVEEERAGIGATQQGRLSAPLVTFKMNCGMFYSRFKTFICPQE